MDDERGAKFWTDLENLRPSIYIGTVPFKGDSSDPETFLEYLEEDHVIDGVEGAAQVEQGTGMPATVYVAHYSVVDVDHGGFGNGVRGTRTDAMATDCTLPHVH